MVTSASAIRLDHGRLEIDGHAGDLADRVDAGEHGVLEEVRRGAFAAAAVDREAERAAPLGAHARHDVGGARGDADGGHRTRWKAARPRPSESTGSRAAHER